MEGGVSSGAYYADYYAEYYAALVAALEEEPPDVIDTAIATFVLFFGLVFLLISSLAMVVFFRERKAFEVRARSAYLAMLNGLSQMAFLAIIIFQEPPEMLSHIRLNLHATSTALFFVAVCNAACYGSRTIRLAVLYSSCARKRAPWLIPERNHVVVCLLLSAASTAVPLYDISQASDGLLGDLEYYLLAQKHLWIVTFSCLGVVLLLNPLAWLVDDIFGIGPELRAMIIVLLATTLTGRLAEEYAAPNLYRWINANITGFLGSVIMVSISVVMPVNRRLLSPLQASDPKVVRALERRRAVWAEKGNTAGASTPSHPFGAEDDNSYFFSSRMPSSTPQPSSAGSSPGTWTYERVMSMPEVSVAFEGFTRKALCQESFLFLKDAARFQAQSFGNYTAGGGGDDGKEGDGGESGSSADDGAEGGPKGDEDEFETFSKIVREYVIDGAPNEINISFKDKTSILNVYNNTRQGEGEGEGEVGFRALPATERRLVFARAYAEIRFMLESNLMQKFVSTDEFDKALTAARLPSS